MFKILFFSLPVPALKKWIQKRILHHLLEQYPENIHMMISKDLTSIHDNNESNIIQPNLNFSSSSSPSSSMLLTATKTATPNKILYLSKDILQLSLQFCKQILVVNDELYNAYYEQFNISKIFSSATKEDFIIFFNICFSEFYNVELSKNQTQNPLAQLKSLKKKTLNACTSAVRILRKSVVSAFLEAYNDEFQMQQENFIMIKEWYQADFSYDEKFTRVKFDNFSGFFKIIFIYK
jgi:hypothetical protein